MVLLASDLRTQRQVALKVVPCDHLDSTAAAKAREAALAEAGMLKRLLHPNIVTCYEMCWDSHRAIVWLALEYMDGGDIQAVLTSRRASGSIPFDAMFVRRVLVAIGSALRFVHREGILHRDVKPGNMLFAHQGEGEPSVQEIKLADFGIAKILEATGSARTVIGTPLYCSPEMVSGKTYGAASDAWALGICLYELATLTRPFEASNQLALARMIVDEPPGPLPKEMPDDLNRAITGLLEKDEHQRLNLGQALRLSPEIRELMIDGPTCVGVDALEELPSASSTPREREAYEGKSSVTPSLPKLQGVPVHPSGPTSTSIMSPRRLLRGGRYARSPRQVGAWCPSDGQPGPAGNEKRKGSRTWFSFLRPSRSKETSSSVSDGETADSTTAVSAFSYPEDLEDSGDDDPARQRPTPKAPASRAEVESERPQAMRAWQ